MRRSWIIRKDEKAVSPVIATILMVAITVVLAAVLYVMVTGLLAGPGASKPQITFTNPTALSTGDGFQFSVAAASQTKTLSNYKVNMQVNSTSPTSPATPPTLVAGTLTFTFAANLGTTYTVQYSDIGVSGNLVAGGQFTVKRTTAPGTLPSGATYTVYLLWSDGSVLLSASYP